MLRADSGSRGIIHKRKVMSTGAKPLDEGLAVAALWRREYAQLF